MVVRTEFTPEQSADVKLPRLSGVMIPLPELFKLGLGHGRSIFLPDLLTTGKVPDDLPLAARPMVEYARVAHGRNYRLNGGGTQLHWWREMPLPQGGDIHYDHGGVDNGTVRLIAAAFPGAPLSGTWFYPTANPHLVLGKNSGPVGDIPGMIKLPAGEIGEFTLDVLHAEAPIPRELIIPDQKRVVLTMTLWPRDAIPKSVYS